MHPYIPYLLEDIAAAHRPEIPEELSPKTFEEEMEEVENGLQEKNRLILSDITAD